MGGTQSYQYENELDRIKAAYKHIKIIQDPILGDLYYMKSEKTGKTIAQRDTQFMMDHFESYKQEFKRHT